MKFKRLVVFGDSWTRGVGSDLYLEKRPFDKWPHHVSKNIERQIQTKYSWPQQLSKKLQVNVINNSETGNSNDKILESILNYHEENYINTKNDLYIIMWSSGLRNNLSFIPNKIKSISKLGLGFNYKSILKQKKLKIRSFNPFFKIEGNSTDENFLVNQVEPFFKKFTDNIILNDIIDNSYFDFMNQMQIYFLQQYLEHFEIKYIMCDAFESMFSYSNKIKSFINLENYYQPHQYFNFRDYLLENYDESYFENYEIEKKYRNNGNHPNKKGYQIISELLFEYIIKKNRLD
jgi:lysophospholipase L1-like esterase